MDKNEISKYASELSETVQAFINEYEHPEDGILIINLANIDDRKVVYIEETLRPATDNIDWAEYPLIDLINDADAPNEKWVIDPKAIEEVTTELLGI